MKVLLDAQISGQGVAAPLRAAGHDVLAVVEYSDLDGASDEDLLKIAINERRVIVTCDAKDFVPLLTRWIVEGDGHCGCVVISTKTLRPEQFGALAPALLEIFDAYPDGEDWRNRLHWLQPI